MRHCGGSTACNDVNGFDNGNSINDDNVGGDKAIAATNIEMDAAKTAAARKTKTTSIRLPQSTASTTGRSHARVAKTGPRAPLPRCPASPGGVPGTSKKMNGKGGSSGKDNGDDNAAATSDG